MFWHPVTLYHACVTKSLFCILCDSNYPVAHHSGDAAVGSLMPIFIPSHVLPGTNKQHRTRPCLGGPLFCVVRLCGHSVLTSWLIELTSVCCLSLLRFAKVLMFHLAICSLLLGILREKQQPADVSTNIRPVCVLLGGSVRRAFSLLSTPFSDLTRLQVRQPLSPAVWARGRLQQVILLLAKTSQHKTSR